jgi:hypothetical protein
VAALVSMNTSVAFCGSLLRYATFLPDLFRVISEVPNNQVYCY